MARKTDKAVLRAIKKKYPTVAKALKELARSGLYGDGSATDAAVEVIRELVIKLIESRNPLIPRTLAFMDKVREEIAANRTKLKKSKTA